MDSPESLDAVFQFLVIGTIVASIIITIANKVFNFKAKSLGRLFMICLIGMLLAGAILVGDSGPLIGILIFMLVAFIMYTIVFGVIGWIYNFITGGKKLTASRLAMFVIGWIGAGKALDWEKRKKEEHEARMRSYEKD